MNDFEKMWRNKILSNTSKEDIELAEMISKLEIEDPILYSKVLIKALKEELIDEKIASIFCKSACHMPHSKLTSVKETYKKTNSLKEAHKALLDVFKKDIKEYKKISDKQLTDILNKGWGAAGILIDDTIIATKIPSMFHEYFDETDITKKKYYYCHCPRVRKELLNNSDIDSIYCNCGGGFYSDIWEYITDKEVEIKVTKNLFDGDEVCQFTIKLKE